MVADNMATTGLGTLHGANAAVVSATSSVRRPVAARVAETYPFLKQTELVRVLMLASRLSDYDIEWSPHRLSGEMFPTFATLPLDTIVHQITSQIANFDARSRHTTPPCRHTVRLYLERIPDGVCLCYCVETVPQHSAPPVAATTITVSADAQTPKPADQVKSARADTKYRCHHQTLEDAVRLYDWLTVVDAARLGVFCEAVKGDIGIFRGVAAPRIPIVWVGQTEDWAAADGHGSKGDYMPIGDQTTVSHVAGLVGYCLGSRAPRLCHVRAHLRRSCQGVLEARCEAVDTLVEPPSAPESQSFDQIRTLFGDIVQDPQAAFLMGSIEALLHDVPHVWVKAGSGHVFDAQVGGPAFSTYLARDLVDEITLLYDKVSKADPSARHVVLSVRRAGQPLAFSYKVAPTCL